MTTFCFRCDADAVLGYGHLARCLTLAEEVRRRGGHVVFLMRRQDEAAQTQVAAQGFAVEPSEPLEAWPNGLVVLDLAHRKAMASPQACDALLARLQLLGRKTIWLDSMGADAAALRLTQFCDFVVSPYLGAEQGLAPRTSCWLAGAGYAILPFEYGGELPARSMRPQRRLLVTMGGSDPWRLSEFVLKVLGNRPQPGWTQRVIAGPFFGATRLDNLRHNFPWAEITDDRADLFADYRDSDAVVTAAGLTRYEIAALGLPGMLISPSDFSRDYLVRFQEYGLAQVMFANDANFSAQLPVALDTLRQTARPEHRLRLIDGLGCRRVVNTLLNATAP